MLLFAGVFIANTFAKQLAQLEHRSMANNEDRIVLINISRMAGVISGLGMLIFFAARHFAA